jgi:hypothetical protein
MHCNAMKGTDHRDQKRNPVMGRNFTHDIIKKVISFIFLLEIRAGNKIL